MTDQLTVPARMRRLARDKHDRPVPWFVAVNDGVPDFRVIRSGGVRDALRFKLCFVCGQTMGANAAFVIGPMCAVNRVSSEPPSHRDCATYSAKACPFLSTPSMKRRGRGLPDERTTPGVMIPRNPGVTLVWVSRRWSVYPDPNGQPLFDIGDPDQTYWYAQGRDATRVEVLASIDSGLPILRAVAEQDGELALSELDALHRRALELVPA